MGEINLRRENYGMNMDRANWSFSLFLSLDWSGGKKEIDCLVSSFSRFSRYELFLGELQINKLFQKDIMYRKIDVNYYYLRDKN